MTSRHFEWIEFFSITRNSTARKSSTPCDNSTKKNFFIG